jgi:CBS domain-containing protein
MKDIPSIKSVMTTFPHWVGSDETVERAKAMMAEHDVGHLPVMDGERLVGLLDARMLGPVPAGARVRDVPLADAHVVSLSEPLDRVLMLMAEHHLHTVLVVKDGKLAGIFTSSDACRSFGRLLRQLFPRGGADDAA